MVVAVWMMQGFERVGCVHADPKTLARSPVVHGHEHEVCAGLPEERHLESVTAPVVEITSLLFSNITSITLSCLLRFEHRFTAPFELVVLAMRLACRDRSVIGVCLVHLGE
jgi:hypothetical protein